jgi:hypothetical protein
LSHIDDDEAMFITLRRRDIVFHILTTKGYFLSHIDNDKDIVMARLCSSHCDERKSATWNNSLIIHKEGNFQSCQMSLLCVANLFSYFKKQTIVNLKKFTIKQCDTVEI